jgi:hypothetical protein
MQVAPYCAFGCDMRQPYPATLFRFPLRTASQAAASSISKQVCLPFRQPACLPAPVTFAVR